MIVNKAGGPPARDFRNFSHDDGIKAREANMLTPIELIKATVDGMIERKFGRIVNITSVVGTLGNPGQANYAASKAGVEAFSRSLARELGSRNITINCVAPGFIDTDLTRALDEKQRNALMSQVPLGRLGTPQDVADAVAFLVGSGATYVTGITLHVNGGMHM